MKRRVLIVGIASGALVVLAVITGISKLFLSTPATVTFGALMPLSGDNAMYGVSLKKGMEVAVSEINASQGTGKPLLHIVFEDDRANPSAGISAFRKLIDVDRVPLVLGGMFSAVTLAIAPIAQQHHVVLLSPTSSAVEITNAGDYVFRIYPSDTNDGAFLAREAFQRLRAKRAVILNLQVASTVAIARVFSDSFTSQGGKILLAEGHQEGATDFRAQLLKVKSLSPDIVFLPSYLAEMARILRQARELGITLHFLSISTFNDPKILTLAGDAAEGVIFSTPTYDADSSDPLVQKFVAAYRNANSAVPDIWASYGYDSVRVAYEAVQRAHPRTTSERIRDAMSNIRDFPGVAGAVTFDANGDVSKDLRLMVVRGGRFIRFVDGD